MKDTERLVKKLNSKFWAGDNESLSQDSSSWDGQEGRDLRDIRIQSTNVWNQMDVGKRKNPR